MCALALLVLCAIARAAHADCAGGWSERAPLTVARQEIGVAAIGDILYAVGGFEDGVPTARAEAYDAVADVWTSIAPLPFAVHHPGAAAVNGTLYVVGGLTALDFGAVDAVFRYDATGNVWVPRAPLPAPRGAVGVAVLDGRIYAAGGFRGGASVSDFAVYDAEGDTWTPLSPMPTARDHLAAAEIGGTIYAVGGRANGVLFGVLEAFDPVSGTWRADLARMPTPRGGLAAAAVGGRLFAFGGEGNTVSPLGTFPETEAYDPANDRWATFDPMPTPRHGTMAAVIGDAIHVPGGAVRQGLGASAAHEVFVPPPADALVITAARRLGERLRLRGRVDVFTAPPGDIAVGVSVTDDAGTTRASLDGLVAHDRRLRHRAPPGSRGVTRLVLRPRRRGGLAVRLRAVLDGAPPAAVTVTLSLGNEFHCGSALLGQAGAR